MALPTTHADARVEKILSGLSAKERALAERFLTWWDNHHDESIAGMADSRVDALESWVQLEPNDRH